MVKTYCDRQMAGRSCVVCELELCDGTKRTALQRDDKVMNDRELEAAIRFLRAQYDRAKRIDLIHNPLAWALYQTWRHVDEPPKEVTK